MGATITFRPRPGIREAIDARCAGGAYTDRSALINAALAEYLGVEMSGGSGDPVQPNPAARSPRRARQAVPSPQGDAPECPHPKEAIKKLPYGKQCTECGQMLR